MRIKRLTKKGDPLIGSPLLKTGKGSFDELSKD